MSFERIAIFLAIALGVMAVSHAPWQYMGMWMAGNIARSGPHAAHIQPAVPVPHAAQLPGDDTAPGWEKRARERAEREARAARIAAGATVSEENAYDTNKAINKMIEDHERRSDRPMEIWREH